jgi:pyruvate,water dikinase
MERELYALQQLRASGESVAFERAIAGFLAGPSGNLGNSGEDLRYPVWRDEPALLIAELDRRIAAQSGDPDERHARLIAEGDAVLARTREQLRDRPEDLASFEELVRVARDVAPLTEEHNFHLDRQIQATNRRFFLALGARLVADGQLASVEDVYLLHVHEIAGALRYGTPLHDLARERSLELASWQRLRYPTTLGAPPGAMPQISTRADLNYRERQDDTNVIKGVPASAGTRRGPARLVRGAQDFTKLKPGDVLVCRSSNVSWVPLFTVATAIVTDVGGALSHAAVVAREFGVPAVVGCGIALDTLRDGELIEVNGDRGTVRRIA